ncbi:BTB/POZ domain-containing protein 19 isoform X2 [Saccopteryx leptura]|uniref:BTB/POZ domain-containing protein 19 isoform X2 n=1 Tax=Saccopteryx leptura TaxID=249018 RepID=UPI00339C01C8
METPGLVVHGEAEPFSTALRSLVNNRLYSDVRFVVGQERQEVFAHRCLLACRCNFFQRLLDPEPGPGVPSPVVLSTVPAEAFLAVLEFLYTNSVKLHRRSVLEVLTAAVEYGLEELRELCLEFVVKVLDVELVCEALQVGVVGPRQVIPSVEGWASWPLISNLISLILLSDGCNLWPGTIAGALHSLHRDPQPGTAPPPHPRAHTPTPTDILLCPDPFSDPQEVLRTRSFLELSAPALLPLLRSDKLCVDEAELVRAARSWARVGAAVLERPVAEVAAPVVRELRLALLAPAELSALEEQNRQEPLIPVEQIVEAWKCHALRRGDAARGSSCRRRRGTLPREHHSFLDLPFK